MRRHPLTDDIINYMLNKRKIYSGDERAYQSAAN